MQPHRVIIIGNRHGTTKRPYYAAVAGFPVNYYRARLSTARRDADAIAARLRGHGDTVEIRDCTRAS